MGSETGIMVCPWHDSLRNSLHVDLHYLHMDLQSGHVNMHNCHMDFQNGLVDNRFWHLPRLGLVDPTRPPQLCLIREPKVYSNCQRSRELPVLGGYHEHPWTSFGHPSLMPQGITLSDALTENWDTGSHTSENWMWKTKNKTRELGKV
jgi:hypothetical protein